MQKSRKTENTEEEDKKRKLKRLKRYIKLANLVDFDAQIDFYSWDLDMGPTEWELKTNNNYLFFLDSWAVRHDLKRYRKLFRYLSFVARTNQSWETAFDNFKNTRDLMKVLVDIADEYQKHNELVQLARAESLKFGNQNLTTLLELGMSRSFNISYAKRDTRNISAYDRFRAYQSEKERPNLAKRLFDAALGFISLSVDSNHQANIELGGFLKEISGTDLRRLKRCRLCKSILWADRLNKMYCSKGCSNTHHQRILRLNPKRKAEINERRKDNYHHKKKPKISLGSINKT